MVINGDRSVVPYLKVLTGNSDRQRKTRKDHKIDDNTAKFCVKRQITVLTCSVLIFSMFIPLNFKTNRIHRWCSKRPTSWYDQV